MQFGGELVVDREYMAVFNFLRFGLLGKHTLGGLPTGQRLQCSHQLSLRDVRLLLDLLQREGKGKVKPLGRFKLLRSVSQYSFTENTAKADEVKTSQTKVVVNAYVMRFL